jgi:hypothetical protein
MTELSLLALAWPGGIAGMAIWVIIVAAVIAIVYIATRAMGVAIPPWVVQVFWVLVIAVVCIFAIRFLLTL